MASEFQPGDRVVVVGNDESYHFLVLGQLAEVVREDEDEDEVYGPCYIVKGTDSENPAWTDLHQVIPTQWLIPAVEPKTPDEIEEFLNADTD